MTIPPIAIYGMGRFGRALAAALTARGQAPVRLGGRSPAPQDFGGPYTQGPEPFLRDLAPGTLVVLAVPDDAVRDAAAGFAALPNAGKLAWVHPSGARGPELLEPLARSGSETGVFHILQTFPPEGGEALIAGSYGTLIGPDRLAASLRALAALIGVTPVTLKPEQRVAYHAAAVMASNAVLGLLSAAQSVLRDAGIEPAAMLLPLVRGTLANAQALGLEAALTGPVVRGDVETVRAHLEALTGESRDAYVAAQRLALNLAERSGRTDPARLVAIRKLLDQA